MNEGDSERWAAVVTLPGALHGLTDGRSPVTARVLTRDDPVRIAPYRAETLRAARLHTSVNAFVSTRRWSA